MKHCIAVNVGLHIGPEGRHGQWSPEDVVSELGRFGFITLVSRVHQSDTEPTLVAVCELRKGHVMPWQDRLSAVSRSLGQDCIAGIALGDVFAGRYAAGVLAGPRPWGEFDPQYFLDLDGKRIEPAVAGEAA